MKILIVSSLHAEAVDCLREEHDVVCATQPTPEELKTLIRDREVLVFRSGVQIDAGVLSSAPRLRLLLRAGSGVDNIDLEYVRRHGLELVRIPKPGAKAVAELAFALMLALSRNLLELDRLTRQGRWAKHEFTGHLLTGKTLGIVGAGNTGSMTGERGAAWGMNVLACVERPTPSTAPELAARGIRLVDFDTVLARADFVSVHVPLKDSTRNLIDAGALARMRPEACLINLARGGIVDESALLRALTAGRLRGAALDVHAREGKGAISPLAGLPNVILTPHIGSETTDSQREIGEIVRQTISERCAAHPHPVHAATAQATLFSPPASV